MGTQQPSGVTSKMGGFSTGPLSIVCTLIDYVVSMYDTYNTIERMSIIARVGGDIDMWLYHFFTTGELVS